MRSLYSARQKRLVRYSGEQWPELILVADVRVSLRSRCWIHPPPPGGFIFTTTRGNTNCERDVLISRYRDRDDL
jgi:hypothetical protein